MSYRAALFAVALAVAPLAACGSGSADATAGSDRTVVFNQADVHFAQGMIAHHEQAIEMADLALDPRAAASADVRALARQIKAAQDPEVATMNGWLRAWGASAPMDHGAGHGTGSTAAVSSMTGMSPMTGAGSMDGMLSGADLTALGAASGTAFDQLWLRGMIAHHRGAIAAATTVQDEGRNPDLVSLAGRIITGQQAEIGTMSRMLAP